VSVFIASVVGPCVGIGHLSTDNHFLIPQQQRVCRAGVPVGAPKNHTKLWLVDAFAESTTNDALNAVGNDRPRTLSWAR
jgi:hypothetical protein